MLTGNAVSTGMDITIPESKLHHRSYVSNPDESRPVQIRRLRESRGSRINGRLWFRSEQVLYRFIHNISDFRKELCWLSGNHCDSVINTIVFVDNLRSQRPGERLPGMELFIAPVAKARLANTDRRMICSSPRSERCGVLIWHCMKLRLKRTPLDGSMLKEVAIPANAARRIFALIYTINSLIR